MRRPANPFVQPRAVKASKRIAVRAELAKAPEAVANAGDGRPAWVEAMLVIQPAEGLAAVLAEVKAIRALLEDQQHTRLLTAGLF